MSITVSQIRATLGRTAVVVEKSGKTLSHIGTGEVTNSPLGASKPPVVRLREGPEKYIIFSDLRYVTRKPGPNPGQISLVVSEGHYEKKFTYELHHDQ